MVMEKKDVLTPKKDCSMSVVSLVKDLSMKKFNGITAVCFVDSVYSMLLYLLVYGKKQFESTYFLFQKQSQLKYRVS